MTTDALEMVSSSPADIPIGYSPTLSTISFRSACVRLTLESPAMLTSVCRNLLLLQDSTASKVSRVQAGGGIEGDGDDRGDGDEDGKSRQFLKQRRALKPSSALLSFIGQPPKISRSNDVIRTREGCAGGALYDTIV